MPSKFFGQFLLERGVIGRDVFLGALQYQKSIQNPTCVVSLYGGYFSRPQLAELDREESGAYAGHGLGGSRHLW